MMKRTIISGILFCSIMLVGCNTTEVLESEQEVVVSQKNGLLSGLQNEIIESITEQTELESDSLSIMLGGGIDELTVSVGFPKDTEIDATLIQQIVEESIKNVSETETVTTSEEKIKKKINIKIEKY